MSALVRYTASDCTLLRGANRLLDRLQVSREPRAASIARPLEILCGRNAFLLVLGMHSVVTVSLAQEQPAFEAKIEFAQSEPRFSITDGASRTYVAPEFYAFVDVSNAARAGVTFTNGAYTEASLRFVAASNVFAGRTIRFYDDARGGTVANALNGFVPAGNRSSDASNAALIALYVATDGDNWRNNANWDINATPTPNELDSWHGVTVRQGKVAELSLSINNLTGTLPAELGDLTSLSRLWMWHNSLSGEIPKELGNLSQLIELRLNNNSLSGPLPTELSNLSKLQKLVLESNSLSGEIPSILGNLSQLRLLQLANNGLSGEIPKELGKLSLLQELGLSGNSLFGELPEELADLSNLQSLSLGINSLSGEIPKGFGRLSQLRSLSLYRNALSGEIPEEIGSLSRLEGLTLFDNSLSGEIPKEFAYLSQLESLSLDNNSLSGEIPVGLGKLSRLKYLSLSGNSLTGEIPREFGNLSQLRGLILSQNSLSGNIPKEFGNLSNLRFLWLQYTLISGEIPKELGGLPQLNSLLLSGNRLSGEIPKELANLSKLEVLWLHGNSLSGEIPKELSSLPLLRALVITSNRLSGEIPSEFGNFARLEALTLSNNSLVGQLPPELGNIAQLRTLALDDNYLTGSLPRSLLQLTAMRTLRFQGQALCAPPDDEFQAWLRRIPNVDGPTCAAFQFVSDPEDQSFTVGQPIDLVVLPEASVSDATLTYSLKPALPAGLVFHEATRTIRGTPAAIAPTTRYIYSATDTVGATAAVMFSIEVVAAVRFQNKISDQSFPRGQPITPLVFPEATGGVPPIEYQLTPSLPDGLDFDAAIRILTGTPTEVTGGTQLYTYSATGSNGSTDRLQFTLEVYSPVAAEHEALPESFVVHGNYPNPFRQSTRLVFDLPWPARVTVEVMDLTGRRVHVVPAAEFGPGWENSIALSGRAMSSGLYLYRLTVASPEGASVHVGRFIRIR